MANKGKIPRNLEIDDTLAIGRFEISWKQTGYLAASGAIVYLSFTSSMPALMKIITSTLSLNISLFACFVKVKGSSADELAINSLYYIQRKIYYNNLQSRRKGGLNVTIKSKNSKTVETKPTSFTI